MMLETLVIDSGIGIEKERQKNLFVPLKELRVLNGIGDRASNDNLGIGLSCSKTIVNRMNGDICLLHSEVGLTAIAFKFPVIVSEKYLPLSINTSL
jgi:signal transduction histidine kinase